MIKLETMLRANAGVSDYKINIHEKKSYELFFVKGKLETVRQTKTTDTEVTVYAAHDEYLGDAKFFVYPSTTDEELAEYIDDAANKAMLINNVPYSLPENEEGSFEVETNFTEFSPEDLAAIAANTVFDANTIENGSLNSVEVFVNHHVEKVINSRGVHKTQTRYDAMVEIIPTYNGADQSVELYKQCKFSSLNCETLSQEVLDMMLAAKARYEAKKPEVEIACNVILNKHELAELFANIVNNLHYASVYQHSTMFHKGDKIQKEPSGDLIHITMCGEAKGTVQSAKFDSDGLSLGEISIVKDGVAVNYFGDNRYGQYLKETPTGNMSCIRVAPGSVSDADMKQGQYLEVISMSGLQVDFFSDYIGGEVRLAYYHDGQSVTPVTGISISGSVADVLSHLRLSASTGIEGGYIGPEKAILEKMKIY